jgi:nitrogen fixation protein FixH
MKAQAWWPVAVVGALGVTMVSNGVLLYRATSGEAAVERDYYRKAIRWDSTAAQERRNQTLGWHLEAALDSSGALVVLLRDAAERPLSGAQVSVEGFPVGGGGGDFTLELEPADPGSYRTAAPIRRGGLHELRFATTLGPDRFTAVLRGEPGGRFGPR